MTQRRIGPYGKLLANYAADDAIIAAGEAAELLFCRAVAFLCTSDSDGYMTDSQIVRYVGAGMRDAVKRADRLVEVGLWLRVDGGYQMRSYLKINESAEEKGRKKRTDRERKRTQDDDGIRDDSERNPSGIRERSGADSLTACIGTTGNEAVQSKKSRAGKESDTDSAPSPFCAKHPNGTDADCRDCGTARRRFDAWVKAQPERDAAARSRAEQARAAANACPDCGGSFWRDDGTKCDHARRAS